MYKKRLIDQILLKYVKMLFIIINKLKIKIK